MLNIQPFPQPKTEAQPEKSHRVIVLGGGVAGLAAAQRLAENGFTPLVIETRDQLGGAHQSREIGPYTFDVGSFFYEESSRLFDLAPDIKALCPTVLRQQRRLAPDGQLRRYPLDLQEFLKSPFRERIRVMADMIRARLTERRDGSLARICRKRLGPRFFENSGLRGYIERFNRLDSSEIDEAFFFHRMGFVNSMTRLPQIFKKARQLALGKIPSPPPKVALRVRPRDGHEPLFSAIRAHLEQAGVRFHLQERVCTVTRHGDGFTVETERQSYTAEALVSSIPLDQLHQMVLGQAAKTQSIDLLTHFVSAKSLHPDCGNVLYNFHSSGKWKRATIYSRIYPTPESERDFFSVETTITPEEQIDPEKAFAAIAEQFETHGLAKDLRYEGHHVTKAAYPLYRQGCLEDRAAAIARLEALGIILVGRQGRFEYLPTATRVMVQVSSLLSDREPLLSRHG